MIRAYLAAGILAALLAVGVWLYWTGREAGELDRARDTIDKRQEIDDALHSCAGADWRRRLLNDCD